MFTRKMKIGEGTLTSHLARSAVGTSIIVVMMSAVTASAGDTVSSDQILQALTPKHLTRSLTAAPEDPAKAAAEKQFVDSIKNRTTRSLSSGERDQIYTTAQDKPNINLEITFDYNSATISSTASPQVDQLGKALTDASMKGSTIVLAGYTDAIGSDTFNQDLSERRADAVKKYLTDKYGLAAGELVTVGYGKTHLKNPDDPKGGENRRVQIVNMANGKN